MESWRFTAGDETCVLRRAPSLEMMAGRPMDHAGEAMVVRAARAAGVMAPEARARAVARATLFGYFGYFFGPPMLGFLAGTFGLRFAFVFAAVMLMAVLVLAPLMMRQKAA